LGIETNTTLDRYDLLTEKIEVKQAAWNVLTAQNDYRVLGPVLTMDPNKNRSAVEHDELGMVVKTAIMGKAGSGDGDTLADPTTRMEYELFNWKNNGKPNFVHSFAREKHGAANPRWQESYTYSNGSGGIALVKAQAHPGKAFAASSDGTKAEVDADPRWIGNGRTILNNKGKPVKQYEPYFSTTHEYEDEKVLREIGVTPVLYYDPLGHNIRTLFPNGTLSRVELTAWMHLAFDCNDTVRQSQWYVARGSPDPAAEPEPQNDPERRAAWLAATHASTPKVTHIDGMERTLYVVSNFGGGKTAAVRSEIDLTGRFSKLFDQNQREVASAFAGMAGTPVLGESAEKGRRWTFQNVLGALVKTWDEHGREFRAVYDALHRPTGTFVQEAGKPEILFNYVVYGDRLANAEQSNLLGSLHQIFDQAGMVRVLQADFKGNPTSVERVLAKDYKNTPDWGLLAGQPDYNAIQAAANPILENAEVFTGASQYDALNRPTQVTLPDGTILLPTYNESNLLASLRSQIRGQGNAIEFLKNQDYDAKGQRLFAHYGNEVLTQYFYDPNSFRLINLLTFKAGSNPQTQALQNLSYTYDPVGNVMQVTDDSQQTNYFRNAVVRPESLYEYDATYQLVRATGRELSASSNDAIRTHADLAFVPQLPHANDTAAVRTYTEEYEYDLLGNIRRLTHHFPSQPGIGDRWTRHYRYAFDDGPADRTNRLIAASMPGDSDAGPYSGTYNYDTYGNMIRMPHLAAMDWDFMDQLRRIDLGGGGAAYYVYGLGGQRLRKVIERNGNLNLEWIFLGGVMIFRRRRRNTGELPFERWTVHISDNTGHIAQVDTKTRDDDNDDPANPLNAALIRYQYTNHLGSAVLETDENGDPISYEEYHPYGTTAYRSAKAGFDLSLKRFRFTGKERDEETGLYYFGARYYAPWLARWTSSDPGGFVDGLDLFEYCHNNPVGVRDRTGQKGAQPDRITYSIETDTFTGGENPTIDDFRHLVGPKFDNRITAKNSDIYFTPHSRLDLESHSFERLPGGTWTLDAAIQKAPPPPPPKKTTPQANGSAGATSQAPAVIKNNPEGFTLEVPNNFDDEKIAAYKDRITSDRGVGNRSAVAGERRSPSGSDVTDRLRYDNRQLVRNYENSLPNGVPSGDNIDHTVELQHVIRGNATAGADTVRPQDHRLQPGALNKSQGSNAKNVRNRSVTNGAPEDVPAGGVARTSEMGLLRNSPRLRSGFRWGGYGLMVAGPALTALSASQVQNPYVRGGGYAAAGAEAGGVGYYFYGRFALGGANGFQAGRAAMALGGRLAGAAGGVAQAAISGYMAYEDAQQGDWTAFAFDAAAALGGVALIAAAIVTAPGWALGLAVVGIATGVAAGVFHAGRYFGWWD
jgi:RHS repeat-associated protein